MRHATLHEVPVADEQSELARTRCALRLLKETAQDLIKCEAICDLDLKPAHRAQLEERIDALQRAVTVAATIHAR